MYGSKMFPLGPNNQFPRQRIGNMGRMIRTPMTAEQMYRDAEAKLPVVEKEFTTSVERAKRRMKMGMSHDMKKLELGQKYGMEADYGLGAWPGRSIGRYRWFGGLLRR